MAKNEKNNIVLIHDVESGEISERIFTAEELLNREESNAVRIAIENHAKTKEIAKAELLSKLGITAEEAVLLLG